MKKCVICGTALETNKSKEHIIHNAIGGSLVDETIYCKKCNELYGSNQDKQFVQIFAPIIDRINIHRSRQTKGTSYKAVASDKNGKIYDVIRKNRKIVKISNQLGHVQVDKNDLTILYNNFELDNIAFKRGISKIAFNYAIHCNISADRLERIFDDSEKELISNPIVIPFFPLSLFDIVMEKQPSKRLFHAVRIFNHKNMLFAYVELFSTFQQYVLLSEKYDFVRYGNIDEGYGNFIETNEKTDEKILMPKNYKDVDIICQQYNLNVEEYKNKKLESAVLFETIGKQAYEKLRKKPYIIGYEQLINQQYGETDVNVWNFESKEKLAQLYQELQWYIEVEEKINFNRYKKYCPNNKLYPITIYSNINDGYNPNVYSYEKFHMLEKHFVR